MIRVTVQYRRHLEMAVIRLNNGGIKDVFRLDGFDHQMSYVNEIAQHTVLYAVAKMAQEIALKEDGTCALS